MSAAYGSTATPPAQGSWRACNPAARLPYVWSFLGGAVPLLPQGRRVVVVDLLGFGRSDRRFRSDPRSRATGRRPGFAWHPIGDTDWTSSRRCGRTGRLPRSGRTESTDLVCWLRSASTLRSAGRSRWRALFALSRCSFRHGCITSSRRRWRGDCTARCRTRRSTS